MGTKALSSKSSAKPLIYCEEGRRLLDAFGNSVHELILFHEQQFLAIMSGDTDCDRFDLLIHMANEQKQKAKYTYLQHLETHGCSTIDDIHTS